jgi:predicted acyl esterase
MGPGMASAAPKAAGNLVQRAESLGLSCSSRRAAEGFSYDFCTGEVQSFDGIGLDTDLSLPTGATSPLPTVLFMHGWSGDKGDWESDSVNGDGKDTYHWNNVWFVSRGWAAVNYTARGFEESCGLLDADAACTTGWTHLADRDFEVRDAQSLLGTLVDTGIATPQRLAATGGSYGGGQSWDLATSMPWTSPKGTTLQLRAAVAKYPWTDLTDSLLPSGRATDSADQSVVHTDPLGIEKDSYVHGLYAAGLALADGRYNTGQDPTDYGSALTEDLAFVDAGEPYDAKPLAPAVVQAFQNKSAYYAQSYFSAILTHSIPEVAVLSIQGWTDPLFPAVQTLQMWRELAAIDPNYPMYMAFGDVGHSNANNPAAQWQPINGLANRFLDAYVLGPAGQKPSSQVTTYRSTCPPPSSGTEHADTGTWTSLRPGRVTAGATGVWQTTSADPNAKDGVDTDPIAHAGCMAEPGDDRDPGGVYLQGTIGAKGFTMLGLPTVTLGYSLVGVDATVALKMWDIGPDGTRTLVTRGAYRLATETGDPASGTFTTELHGNEWSFAPGHTFELQISQADSPYLRPDNLESTITYSSVKVVLPTKEHISRSIPLR